MPSTASIPDRRYDLDWIRVGAFFLLILYHVGMFYVPWDWHVKSPHPVEGLELPMFLTNPWRLTCCSWSRARRRGSWPTRFRSGS
jgi:glucan biosynthesis protein C